MRRQSRREFLKYLIAVSCLLAGGARACRIGTALAEGAAAVETVPRGREFLVLCHTDVKDPLEPDVTFPGSIHALDVQSGEVSVVELPFFGHAVNQRTRYPEQVGTFEKWGRHGAIVDIKARKVLSEIESNKDTEFFGHAVFSADGSLLINTEESYIRKDSGRLGSKPN